MNEKLDEHGWESPSDEQRDALAVWAMGLALRELKALDAMRDSDKESDFTTMCKVILKASVAVEEAVREASAKFISQAPEDKKRYPYYLPLRHIVASAIFAWLTVDEESVHPMSFGGDVLLAYSSVIASMESALQIESALQDPDGGLSFASTLLEEMKKWEAP